jgi:hypothetical protein
VLHHHTTENNHTQLAMRAVGNQQLLEDFMDFRGFLLQLTTFSARDQIGTTSNIF